MIIGESPKTRQVVRNIGKIASGRFPVLILGETGTGKEVAARSIYEACPRGPFVTIDCSSLVGPLLESELFGHARGAFTGAVAGKIVLIELANGGTAFFDEIGELPLDLQAKLLRVLQEKQYRPVGSLYPKNSDFRIIAATGRDLAGEVQAGRFRQDLYYRLNVVTVRLAPLRERPEDIASLVQHFLRRYGAGHTLSEDAAAVLQAYSWPGNVRELENCIRMMIAMSDELILRAANIPETIRVAPSLEVAGACAGGGGRIGVQRPPTLLEIEKQAILQALQYTKGDRSAAAEVLGISRATLYRKFKELAL